MLLVFEQRAAFNRDDEIRFIGVEAARVHWALKLAIAPSPITARRLRGEIALAMLRELEPRTRTALLRLADWADPVVAGDDRIRWGFAR